jgi:cobalt-zinc-cadmium efflux system outer membrane protein
VGTIIIAVGHMVAFSRLRPASSLPSPHFREGFFATFLAATLAITVTPSIEAQSLPINLQEALQVARDNSAILEAARHRIEESQGDVVSAGVRLLNNPELSVAIGPRKSTSGPGTRSTDYGFGLEQSFELRGQRSSRMEEAINRLAATQYEAEDVQRVVDLAIALTFYEAIARTQEVVLREEGEGLTYRLFDLAQKRLELGEGTPLELNTALLRSAAARRQLLAARSNQRLGSLRLGELLGMGPTQTLEPKGDLPKNEIDQTEASLVSRALESRPAAIAVDHLVDAARAAADLSDARAWPGLRAGISLEREENDEIILGSISIPLPFANRNRGERLRSRATIERVVSEGRSVRIRVETEVRTAFAEYERTRESLELFDADVLAAQRESLGLLERALEAGEVGYAEVLLVQREVLEARADHLEARLAFAQAKAALLAATHLPQTHLTGGTP